MAKTVSERADVLPALAEVFREHGFEGASLSLIGQRTKLGKGSLYHFFPGGKEEMAVAVLDEIDGWFTANVFKPLREEVEPRRAIAGMLQAVDDYFRSGRRVCLIGAFALGDARDRFARQIRSYFATWNTVLAEALMRLGKDDETARNLAEETLAAIQGGLVLARALNDPCVFQRMLCQLKARLAA